MHNIDNLSTEKKIEHLETLRLKYQIEFEKLQLMNVRYERGYEFNNVIEEHTAKNAKDIMKSIHEKEASVLYWLKVLRKEQEEEMKEIKKEVEPSPIKWSVIVFSTLSQEKHHFVVNSKLDDEAIFVKLTNYKGDKVFSQILCGQNTYNIVVDSDLYKTLEVGCYSGNSFSVKLGNEYQMSGDEKRGITYDDLEMDKVEGQYEYQLAEKKESSPSNNRKQIENLLKKGKRKRKK